MKRWVVKKLPREVVAIFLDRAKAESYQQLCSQYFNGEYVVEQAVIQKPKTI